MTDRELLELAAKAAGYDVIWNEHWKCFQHRSPIPDANGNIRYPWTPDTDDGDALRLEIDVGIDMSRLYVVAWDATCRYAATRRAIVRSAAEIGKAMQ